MVNETKKQTQDNSKEDFDEYEQSAIMFNNYSKVFRKQLYKLASRKKKAASRVLEAMLFSPLEEVELQGKEEQELLDLCSRIVYHKMKIIEFAELENQEAGNLEKENENE